MLAILCEIYVFLRKPQCEDYRKVKKMYKLHEFFLCKNCYYVDTWKFEISAYSVLLGHCAISARSKRASDSAFLLIYGFFLQFIATCITTLLQCSVTQNNVF